VAKPLVIVESKAKADTIAGFLGRDRYTVMASVGHIRDLPQGAKQAPKSVTNPAVRRLGIDVVRTQLALAGRNRILRPLGLELAAMPREVVARPQQQVACFSDINDTRG